MNLWLDPHEPRTGSERVFVSHAHADHVEAHREIVLSAPTAKLMRARIGGQPIEHVLPFAETREFNAPAASYRLTLLPAGHIFGSAMALIEAEGQTLLYTGDFKLRRGLSAEPCEPRRADALIMETTYGRPEYLFPPTEDVLRGIIRFCREALDNDETAVLYGYSLGKSQELLCSLAEAGLPLVLHGSVYKLTKIYEQFGYCFPAYERYEAGRAKGKVLLCPPNASASAMLRNLGPVRTAVMTGWAMDPNCRYRYQADAAFPLSDHADFSDLVEFVKRVQPTRVYTLHGFAADFSGTLRELGFDAVALSEQEQMTLGLSWNAEAGRTRKRVLASMAAPWTDTPARAEALRDTPGGLFMRFAETCAAIAETSSKLEKVRFLAGYLQTLSPEQLKRVAVWFTGAAFPGSENKVLQLGWALLRDALCVAGGIDEPELLQVYLKHSDLGETAFEVLSRREAPGSSLTVEAVDRLFDQIHGARGPTGKLPILVAALRLCSALEARFLVKIITTDLRIGLKEGLVEEAIASAFAVPAGEVRQANLLLGHVGEAALLARSHRLDAAAITPFRPVKFMLASPEETSEAIWERMQNRKQNQPAAGAAEATPRALWLEDKYDGVRCQLHRVGDRVALYSRDLKDITSTFLELADAARRFSAGVILDGEVLAMQGEEVLPFSELQKRLGRREGDLFMEKEIPIRFLAFDLLWRDGESFLNRPLAERRQELERLAPWPPQFGLARITPAASVEEIEGAFAAARGRNNEGLMVKDPQSSYTPGRRGLAWLKLKKAFATLDCVVVGAEYGHGKRKDVLSDYTFAVRDAQTGDLKTIGKAYSGLTDVEIARLTEHFLNKVIRRHGRYHEVEPDTVLEIAFDRLQPSDRHNSGLAMRFPRIVRIRTDKTPAEIDTLEAARRLVAAPWRKENAGRLARTHPR